MLCCDRCDLSCMGAKAQGPQGLDVVFARLQSQLEGRQFKKALKTCEEGECLVLQLRLKSRY